MKKKPYWRSAVAVRTALVAALAASFAVGGYDYTVERSGANGGDANGGSNSTSAQFAATSFTSASVGDCLNWDVNPDGSFSNFGQADCEGPHRFEISTRENLATYPSSEFGPNAKAPDLTRQAQLREELCKTPTTEYLGGRFDPLGRYSIAPILPPAEAWAAGDRTMLCGVQVTDEKGIPVQTVGAATKQDQSRVSDVGQCVAVDPSGASRVVDCALDHALEITSVENLVEHFTDGIPTVEEQDKYLQQVCTEKATSYLGGDDALYNSTLQPFWTSINTNSWVGGSHTVNCALFKANSKGTFATLKGSAKGEFTIDGGPPPPQPTRNPLRSQAPAAPAPAEAPAAPAAPAAQ